MILEGSLRVCETPPQQWEVLLINNKAPKMLHFFHHVDVVVQSLNRDWPSCISASQPKFLPPLNPDYRGTQSSSHLGADTFFFFFFINSMEVLQVGQ